jgi:hypothetical protein
MPAGWEVAGQRDHAPAAPQQVEADAQRSNKPHSELPMHSKKFRIFRKNGPFSKIFRVLFFWERNVLVKVSQSGQTGYESEKLDKINGIKSRTDKSLSIANPGHSVEKIAAPSHRVTAAQ